MSFFLPSTKTKPSFTGLSTQTSTSNAVIPICWGQTRIAPNILWQGDFQSHKLKKQGKGGGGKAPTGYSYTASFILGLCWGEIEDIISVWKDSSRITAANSDKLDGVSYSYFLGTTPQSPWGYMVTAHPDEALGYPGIAYAGLTNYDMGQTNTIGQHSFEIKALRWDTASGGDDLLDADPALIIEDVFSSELFGVGLSLSLVSNLYSTVAATSTGDNTLQTYCRAMGFGLSPALTNKENARSLIERWCKLCNIAPTWNGYKLSFIPYGIEEVEDHGVKYVPAFSVVYSLSPDDFLTGDNPISFDRSNPSTISNSLSIIIADRDNEYNDLPVSWKDQGLIDEYGVIPSEDLDAKEITRKSMAEVVVSLMGQRLAYIRNSFSFKLPPKFCRLEPMDLVELTSPPFLTSSYALLTSVVEDEDGTLSCIAEEYSGAVASVAVIQAPQNVPKNTALIPGPVNEPIFFEPASTLSSTPQVWVAVSGGDGDDFDPKWGGAIVWLSTDGVKYVRVGEVTGPARMGKLTSALADYTGANPDTTHTLKVDLTESGGELDDEVSALDASLGQNLIYVDDELLAFETPTLTDPYSYDLDNLWRGLYNTTVTPHPDNAPFFYVDENIFKYELPPGYIGQLLYLKFQGVNVYGLAAEDLSTVTAYSYTPVGRGFGPGTGGLPSTPTGLTASEVSNALHLSWNSNPTQDGVIEYVLYRADGEGEPFSSASELWRGYSTSFLDPTFVTGMGYTYFISAVNAIGESAPSSGEDSTPLGEVGYVNSVKSTADWSNDTSTLTDVTGLELDVLAPAIYRVTVNGSFTSDDVSSGIGLALDIPIGAIVFGSFYHRHNTDGDATAAGQLSDSTVNGLSTGVQAIATETPFSGQWIVETTTHNGQIALRGRPRTVGQTAAIGTGKAYLTIHRVK